LSNFAHRRHCNFSYFCEKIGENVEFKFCNPQKALPCAKPRHMSYRALKSVQLIFLWRTARKKREGKGRKGKGRHKKSRKRYISPIRGEAPRKRIFTKFCTSGDILDVIICANFGVEKLRSLRNTRGQILEFPIEMAGHLYNRAGATPQPVIVLSAGYAPSYRINVILMSGKLYDETNVTKVLNILKPCGRKDNARYCSHFDAMSAHAQKSLCRLHFGYRQRSYKLFQLVSKICRFCVHNNYTSLLRVR